MINERQFAQNFSGFWRTSLPNLESVLRVLNLGPERLQRPLAPLSDPHRRDLISEAGFRLSSQKWRGGLIADADVAGAYHAAVNFLVDEADLGTEEKYPFLDAVERDEVIQLSKRIGELIKYKSPITVKFFPEFSGLGMLGQCRGDILCAGTIVEIKYVDRAFRSTDLKQAISYAALGRLSGQNISDILIYNPLRGTYIESSLIDLVFGASGQSVEQFEFEMTQALSASGVSR